MNNEYRVLTPESVEFVYELGGIGSRVVAAVIDHLLILVALLLVWVVACGIGPFTLALFGPLFGPLVAAARLAVFLVGYGYFVYFEWRWNGQTPGKRLMELRAIDDRGISLDLSQSLLRNLFRVVDMMPFFAIPGLAAMALEFLGVGSVGFYAIGGVAACLSPSGKRLGDWAAGTLVVRTRRPILPESIIAPNEKYNTLQQDAALRARIRTRLTLEERESLLQLCLRRNQLEFEARRALFADAAAHLEERLELRREEFMSEEKLVQNIAAVALEER